MAIFGRQKKPSQFQRATDGSMTLMEHFRELRSRLFKASLAILVGFIVGYILSKPAFHQLQKPYCDLLLDQGKIAAPEDCTFLQLSPTDGFILRLKIMLWLALIVSAPVWLYQLWAFVAPGLHRHERRWAYTFVAIAVPLFLGGAALAYFVVGKGLGFLLESGLTGVTVLEITGYTSFVTGMILVFGLSFEFPLLLLMLNFAGVVRGRRMLGWWRVVVFLAFVLAAVATPDPGPFGMTLLAAVLILLYFIAVGVAMLNDRRKSRRDRYATLDDDEASSLDDLDADSVEQGERIHVAAPVETPTPIDEPAPLPRHGYDEMT